MKDKYNSNIFSDLKDYGLDDLCDLKLYKTKDVMTEQELLEETSPINFLFDRKLTCPICESTISVRAVKSSGIRVLSRDTDFMVNYQEPNPLFYDVWLCVNCGYAAPSSRFNTINNKQIKLIKEKLCPKWKLSKNYPSIYDENIAVEFHQLALLNTVIKMGRASEKASICLKLAWLYRIKKDINNENKFIYQAIQGFSDAYENENFPFNGLDEPSVEYLIGELYRRLGENSLALKWLSKVLSSRIAKEKIKDMARTQKDIIRDLMCNKL